jgi:hypothetical protein
MRNQIIYLDGVTTIVSRRMRIESAPGGNWGLNCNSAKLLLTDQRASLKEDAIEANECLRQWEKAGLLRWE